MTPRARGDTKAKGEENKILKPKAINEEKEEDNDAEGREDYTEGVKATQGAKGGGGKPTTAVSLRRRGETNHRGEKPESLAQMTSQRATQRKS